MKVKVIANYLPQYHRIPENDKWWGEGYTDWVATKNAKPLFEGHQQPRVPLNENYYDLSDVNTIRWQAELAKKYGVYGFGIYHYWFSTELQLLQKPAELLLSNKDIDIHFMFIWDNGSWIRSWTKITKGNDWAPNYEGRDKDSFRKGNGILAELKYGDEKEWRKHFEYLVPFFKDRRYIKIDDKPLFCFFATNNNFKLIKRMAKYWNRIALEYGIPGVVLLCQKTWNGNTLDYAVRYHAFGSYNLFDKVCEKIKRKYCSLQNKLCTFDYDMVWEKNIRESVDSSSRIFLSACSQYDDTPRRGQRGMVVTGSTPAKFQKYFTELLKISKARGKEYVFCPAWNEWGEGMYLEPDTLNGYGYLEALKAAVEEVNGTK